MPRPTAVRAPLLLIVSSSTGSNDLVRRKLEVMLGPRDPMVRLEACSLVLPRARILRYISA